MSVTIDNGITFNDATEMTDEPRVDIHQPSSQHPNSVVFSKEDLVARRYTVPVGTYAALKSLGSQPVLNALLPITAGTEVDGYAAQLHPSDRSGSSEGFAPERYMAGTWRCMGYIAGTTDRTCIWLKVAD